MRFLTLLREALASAWAAKVPTLLTLLVTAAMCFTASVTAGRNAELARDVEARTRDAGARVISITDLGDDGFLTEQALGTLAGLSSVEMAAAVTQPGTFTNAVFGWGGPTVSGWGVLGDPSRMVELVTGRWPAPGEALISVRAAQILRLEVGSGGIVDKDEQTFAVVGTFRADAPFDWLEEGVVLVPRRPQVGRQARVGVREVGQLAPTERAIRRLLAPQDPAKLRITSPRELAEVSLGVGSDVAAAGYQVTVLVLVVGALFVSAVTLADVLIRRRDLGRRRALGITRFDLVALICLRATLATVAGAVLGVVAVQAYGLAAGARPPLAYSVAGATLVVICAIVATLPVGLLAASRDPVAVLRTP